MPMLMGQEKQRISERLQRLDAQRERLSAQLARSMREQNTWLTRKL